MTVPVCIILPMSQPLRTCFWPPPSARAAVVEKRWQSAARPSGVLKKGTSRTRGARTHELR